MNFQLGKAIAAFTACYALSISQVYAIPALQLYVEGGTYNTTTDTWVGGANDEGKVIIWVIGNGGPHDQNIDDVRMSIVFNNVVDEFDVLIPEGNDEGGLDLNLVGERMGTSLVAAGSGTGSYLGFSDSWASTAEATGFTATRNLAIETLSTLPLGLPDEQGDTVTIDDPGKDDSPLITPKVTFNLLNASSISPHSWYTDGHQWQEYDIMDFDFSDVGRNVTIADFEPSFPSPSVHTGQIFAYAIDIGEAQGYDLHLDVYGVQNGEAIAAPFSHDALAVPEPSTFFLMSIGCGVARWARRRKKKA